MNVCGIDVGTTAVRVAVCAPDGQVLSSSACPLPRVRSVGPRREQDARAWWHAVAAALRAALVRTSAAEIGSVAVDGTSGTVVLVDANLVPVSAGILYNDGRAAGYGARIDAVAGEFIERHGYGFKDNFALPRLLWLAEHDPSFGGARWALHQSDFINARLAGGVTATDWSTALKTGCDLHRGVWADFVGDRIGFPRERLPSDIVGPGVPLGVVCREAAAKTGLRMGTVIVAGATDGTAALFASGARQPGDFNTVLGSTITVKGVTPNLVRDAEGVVYCHRHPAGYWLPGGASNVGCAALDRRFAPDPGQRAVALRALDAAADRHLPSAVAVYPLGDAAEERFPFRKTGLGEFMAGEAATEEALYAAYLQGIAFVERWCYEKLAALGVVVERLFSTGGGSKSGVWNRVRADVLRRPLCLPEQAETAFGAAILAAGRVHGSVERAAAAMVRIREQVEPGPRSFDEAYARFRAECAKRWGV